MSLLNLGSVRVDLDGRWIDRDGVRERLTTLEAELLRHLHAAGKPVSREELLARVWGYGPTVVSRACDTTVKRLRAKLEDDPAAPAVLVTFHGLGYRLVTGGAGPEPAPAEEAPARSRRRYALGDRTVDLDRQRVDTPGGPVPLTGTEAVLLEVLIGANGAAIERDTLQRRVWGTALGQPLPNAVVRLRRKLEAEPGRPRFLVTTASGYRLDRPGLDAPPPDDPLRPVPAEVDRRFGRDDEIRAVEGCFAAGDRLITLTGPGGVGKTRLAIAVALRMEAAWPRVVWVDASEVQSVGGLVELLAAALRVRLASEPLETVVRALRVEVAPALVLDNLEQIPAVGAAVSALLTGVPSLRILATSRVALRIRGERAVTVEPLPAEQAAELFLDRAPQPPPASERDQVLALVRELDGLPLAVELAAARTRLLPIGGIRERMREGLRLLSPSAGRYGSLRVSIDGSYELLGRPARAALAQLGVFEGSFGVDAALAVIDLGAWPEVDWPLDVLQDLVDSSLLSFDATERRFSLLFVLREYARERLAPEDRAGAELRHGRFYADRLRCGGEPLPNVLQGPAGDELRQELERDLPNVVAALERARARGDSDVAIGALRAAWEIWRHRGPLGMARAAIERTLDAMPEGPRRTEVELWAGRACLETGDLPGAERRLQDARAAAARHGDLLIEAEAVRLSARLYLDSGRAEEGGRLAREGLELARRTGLWSVECAALLMLAFHLHHTRPDETLDTLARALALAEEHGATHFVAQIRFREGVVALSRGRLEEAGERFEQSLAHRAGSEAGETLFYRAVIHHHRHRDEEALAHARRADDASRRSGHTGLERQIQELLGVIHERAGRWDDAEACHREALRLARASGSANRELQALNRLAGLVATRPDGGPGSLEEAAELCRRALSLAERLGEPTLRTMILANSARLAFLAGAWAEGTQAVQEALAIAATGYDGSRAVAELELANALANRDRLAEAREHAASALARAARGDDDQGVADAMVLLAALDARDGRAEAAAQRLDGLGGDVVSEPGALWLARAEIAHARGDAAALAEALAEARRLANPAYLGARFRALAIRGR